MYDLQIVFPIQAIPLTNVTEVPGLGLRTLDVRGEDFRSVDEVLLNEVPSPSVVVLSQTRMLVQVPEPLKYDRITSISVTSARLTLSARSLLRFKIGTAPQRVSGMLRLMQMFLKLLFQTPGTDVFEPALGGGALRAIGASFSKGQAPMILADLVVAVSSTERQMIAIQARQSRLPREEKLLSAKVTGSGFNPLETALLVSMEIRNQAGKVGTANVEY